MTSSSRPPDWVREVKLIRASKSIFGTDKGSVLHDTVGSLSSRK